jgi:hypothetical protein
MRRAIRFLIHTVLSGLGAIVILTLLTAGVCAAFKRRFVPE